MSTGLLKWRNLFIGRVIDKMILMLLSGYSQDRLEQGFLDKLNIYDHLLISDFI